MSEITLTLPYPCSANMYWRTYMPKGFKAPVTTLSKQAKDYKSAVYLLAKEAGVRKPRPRRELATRHPSRHRLYRAQGIGNSVQLFEDPRTLSLEPLRFALRVRCRDRHPIRRALHQNGTPAPVVDDVDAALSCRP